MNTTRRVRQYQTSHWFIFAIILSATIVMDYLYQSQLQTLSMNKFVEFVPKYCQFKKDYIFSVLFVSYGIEGIICILLLLVYNFGNIFKFIILLTSIQVSFLFISIFQLIYRSRKPIIFDNPSMPCYSSNVFFGNPSIRIFLSSVFFLTLHRITFHSSRFVGRPIIKFLGFILSLFVIFIISAFTWITGLNSLDQMIFGGLLGYCVYFFYFFVLNINSNNPKQLHKLVVFPLYYYFIVLSGICLGYFLLFLILKDYKESNKQLNDLQKEICKEIVINRYFSLYNGSLSLFILSLTNISTILGLKTEYLLIFESNYINWLQYNFEKDEEKNDDDSLCSKLCINKDIQWNHTGLYISIMRLIFICLLLAGSVVLFQSFGFPRDNISIFLSQVFLISNSICFGLCFFYKIILKWLKVTNITLFTILRESI